MKKKTLKTERPTHHVVTDGVGLAEIKAKLERESKLVSEDSMRMNAILEVLEDSNDQL
jgi:hypothetical protein